MMMMKLYVTQAWMQVQWPLVEWYVVIGNCVRELIVSEHWDHEQNTTLAHQHAAAPEQRE